MIRRSAEFLAALLIAAPAVAGPPYQTDDPEPTELRHWEIYNFLTFDGHGGDYDGAAGFDLNYGAARGLQLTATLPLAFERTRPGTAHLGAGDLELGAKYRFIDDQEGGWQAAVFPRVIMPTAAHDLGGRHARLLLPLWVQKDLGSTSVFGGGGFEINPEAATAISGRRESLSRMISARPPPSAPKSLGSRATRRTERAARASTWD